MIATTVPLAATPSGDSEFDIFGNILASQGVVLGVLIVLVVMSLICWFIIGYKYLWYIRQSRASKRFMALYWDSENPGELYEMAKEQPHSPEARMFVAGFRELGNLKKRNPKGVLGGFENIERAIKRARADEVTQLESTLQFLATTGSTAPFIGLFGTVWGIMRAFAGLGQMEDTSNLLTTVTPHIAEALVATAIGLAAAIPAVMAYNYYVNRIRRTVVQIDGFGADYLNTLRRLYFPQ